MLRRPLFPVLRSPFSMNDYVRCSHRVLFSAAFAGLLQGMDISDDNPLSHHCSRITNVSRFSPRSLARRNSPHTYQATIGKCVLVLFLCQWVFLLWLVSQAGVSLFYLSRCLPRPFLPSNELSVQLSSDQSQLELSTPSLYQKFPPLSKLSDVHSSTPLTYVSAKPRFRDLRCFFFIFSPMWARCLA